MPRRAVLLLTGRGRLSHVARPYEPYYLDDRTYFELANFYDEFAKPWDRRRLPMRYQSREDALDVYRLWRERNGGERRIAGAPAR